MPWVVNLSLQYSYDLSLSQPAKDSGIEGFANRFTNEYGELKCQKNSKQGKQYEVPFEYVL